MMNKYKLLDGYAAYVNRVRGILIGSFCLVLLSPIAVPVLEFKAHAFPDDPGGGGETTGGMPIGSTAGGGALDTGGYDGSYDLGDDGDTDGGIDDGDYDSGNDGSIDSGGDGNDGDADGGTDDGDGDSGDDEGDGITGGEGGNGSSGGNSGGQSGGDSDTGGQSGGDQNDGDNNTGGNNSGDDGSNGSNTGDDSKVPAPEPSGCVPIEDILGASVTVGYSAVGELLVTMSAPCALAPYERKSRAAAAKECPKEKKKMKKANQALKQAKGDPTTSPADVKKLKKIRVKKKDAYNSCVDNNESILALNFAVLTEDGSIKTTRCPVDYGAAFVTCPLEGVSGARFTLSFWVTYEGVDSALSPLQEVVLE